MLIIHLLEDGFYPPEPPGRHIEYNLKIFSSSWISFKYSQYLNITKSKYSEIFSTLVSKLNNCSGFVFGQKFKLKLATDYGPMDSLWGRGKNEDNRNWDLKKRTDLKFPWWQRSLDPWFWGIAAHAQEVCFRRKFFGQFYHKVFNRCTVLNI